MTRKGYVAMAKTIRYHVEGADPEQLIIISRLIKDLAYDLKQDNIRFDRTRFLEACGVTA